MKSISKIIETFVKGKLKIGTQKFYDSEKNGGLGLFKVQDFLFSQCCAWVRRSVTMDDLWKRELWFKSYGTVFNLRKASFDAKKNPILYFISACFEKFIFNFTSVNENYLKAPIFENPCLPFDVNNNNFLKKSFFSDEEFALY